MNYFERIEKQLLFAFGITKKQFDEYKNLPPKSIQGSQKVIYSTKPNE